MNQFKLYDVVALTHDIGGMPKGTIGTVLIVYSDGKQYEVEFVDDDKNTLQILTVIADEIELRDKRTT